MSLSDDIAGLEEERDSLAGELEDLRRKFDNLNDDYMTLGSDYGWLERYAEWVDNNYPEARATWEALEKLKESAK